MRRITLAIIGATALLGGCINPYVTKATCPFGKTVRVSREESPNLQWRLIQHCVAEDGSALLLEYWTCQEQPQKERLSPTEMRIKCDARWLYVNDPDGVVEE